MVSWKVDGDLSASELGGESHKTMRHPSLELDRDDFTVGYPVGADEELGKIPFVVRVCKEHLGADVSAEAFGTLGDNGPVYFCSGCVPLRAKLTFFFFCLFFPGRCLGAVKPLAASPAG